jgi:hypothetical protein
VNENEILRRMLGPKIEEVRGGWKKLRGQFLIHTIHDMVTKSKKDRQANI